ncbi:hypothetical protein [Xanthomonas sp. MUS 060]|nr:hypothetical protein [Xanthomonas sp. MUS 060]
MPAALREEAIRLGAIPMSRYTLHEQMKVMIHQARAQVRGEAS